MATKLIRIINKENKSNVMNLAEKNQKEELNIDKKLRATPPLDFSFKKIISLADPFSAKPREVRVGKIPSVTENNKYVTKSVWLDNNFLVSTIGLENFINNCLEFPLKLSWLDLAFNDIKEIYSDIVKFSNLVILYLHGNAIPNFDTIIYLRQLPKLKRLSLHRNPVSDLPMYRECMAQIIPQVVNLDFSPLLKPEKDCLLSDSLKKKYNLLSKI